MADYTSSQFGGGLRYDENDLRLSDCTNKHDKYVVCPAVTSAKMCMAPNPSCDGLSAFTHTVWLSHNSHNHPLALAQIVYDLPSMKQ